MVEVPGVPAAALACALLGAAAAHAQAPADIANAYEAAARQASPQFAGFSAERGKAFFRATHGGEWSCASCHTEDPAGPGRHARTGKAITALAPAANPERFTSLEQAEKWFRRNCNDVLSRTCTAQEKGDVLAYLMQLDRREQR
ncbi:MAG TPA: DUF1924 domain-containing protein [Casimicrobiaceae bacterium]